MGTRYERTGVVAWLVLTGVLLAWLAISLPAHGFTAGDPGVKLIAALEAAAHPTRLFQIDLPTVAGRPVRYVERFFTLHGDHMHALQSPLFPVLAAPFVWLGGLRAAYLIPAASFIVLLWCSFRVHRALNSQASLTVFAAVATLASPLFFYVLDFWEHVPAAACLAAGTMLALESKSAAEWRIGRSLLAGIVGGVAVLLRPEAVWYALGLGLLFRGRRWASYLAGFAAVTSLYAVANVVESGNPVGYHAAANLASLGDRWLATRAERAVLWMGLDSPCLFAGVAAVGAAWCSARMGLATRFAQAFALGGAAVVGTASALGAFGADTLWHAWPIGLVVATPRANSHGDGALWWLLGVSFVGVWLTSTHDGGAQWGPRMLLIATPVLVVLSASAVNDCLGPGRAVWLRRGLVCVLLLGGIWTTRTAYLELRSAKRHSAGLVDSIERVAPTGSYVVSNVWWLDQLAASLHFSRTFLFAESTVTARAILAELEGAGIDHVVLAWSLDPTEMGSLEPATSDTCYAVKERFHSGEPAVTLATATCLP